MSQKKLRPGELPMAEPLAYFLTWSTYGTWLPGDQRGWVEYRHGWQLPSPILQLEAKAKMAEDACILDPQQRELVEQTIAQHCQLRGWLLHTVNCRTNHLHVVVSGNASPRTMQIQFKAWCTRKLKELEQQRQILAGLGSQFIRENWWAERGSRRYINDEDGLETVILYVRDGQDW